MIKIYNQLQKNGCKVSHTEKVWAKDIDSLVHSMWFSLEKWGKFIIHIYQAIIVRHGRHYSIIHCAPRRPGPCQVNAYSMIMSHPSTSSPGHPALDRRTALTRDTCHANFSSVPYSFFSANSQRHPFADLYYLSVLSTDLNSVQPLDHYPLVSWKNRTFSDCSINKKCFIFKMLLCCAFCERFWQEAGCGWVMSFSQPKTMPESMSTMLSNIWKSRSQRPAS